MSILGLPHLLAGASGYTDPLIASVTIFLLTAFIGWRLFSELPLTKSTWQLALAVGLSGAASLGTVVVAGASSTLFGKITGVFAIAIATAAGVGGFLMARRLSVDETAAATSSLDE